MGRPSTTSAADPFGGAHPAVRTTTASGVMFPVPQTCAAWPADRLQEQASNSGFDPVALDGQSPIYACATLGHGLVSVAKGPLLHISDGTTASAQLEERIQAALPGLTGMHGSYASGQGGAKQFWFLGRLANGGLPIEVFGVIADGSDASYLLVVEDASNRTWVEPDDILNAATFP